MAAGTALQRAGNRIGVKPTNHAFRRTFGRSWWLADTLTETIADIMDHGDTKTTMGYLDIDMDGLDNVKSIESATSRILEDFTDSRT